MTDSTDNARPLGPWQAFPAAPSLASQTQEGGRMDDLLQTLRDHAAVTNITGGYPVDKPTLTSRAADEITTLRARLEAVEKERDFLEKTHQRTYEAGVSHWTARAEKAEAALADALREREIGITEGDIVANMNVASLHGELLATKAALADARRDADKLTNHLFHALPRWIDATADWDDGGEAAIAEMQELLRSISPEPAPMTPAIARGEYEI